MARYIDADLLVEVWSNKEKDYYSNKGIIHTIEEIPTADVVPAPQWISTEDRLPSEEDVRRNDNEFIVIIKGAKMATMLYYDDGVWRDINDNPYKVTHWMPMPAPPKGVNGNG